MCREKRRVSDSSTSSKRFVRLVSGENSEVKRKSSDPSEICGRQSEANPFMHKRMSQQSSLHSPVFPKTNHELEVLMSNSELDRYILGESPNGKNAKAGDL